MAHWMQNHRHETHNDQMVAECTTESQKYPWNLFGPSALSGKTFGIFLKKALISSLGSGHKLIRKRGMSYTASSGGSIFCQRM